MPVGAFATALPSAVYLVYHLAAALAGGYFAFRAFGAAHNGAGWAFTLFAVAELTYASANLDLTVLLFAHVLANLLVVAAMVMLFAATVRRAG